VGFLKKLIECEAVTKMSATNLVNCMAPNLFNTSSIQDPSQIRGFTNMTTKFLVQLCAAWDAHSIYLLPKVQLQRD
jgi:hypothetical protein